MTRDIARRRKPRGRSGRDRRWRRGAVEGNRLGPRDRLLLVPSWPPLTFRPTVTTTVIRSGENGLERYRTVAVAPAPLWVAQVGRDGARPASTRPALFGRLSYYPASARTDRAVTCDRPGTVTGATGAVC